MLVLGLAAIGIALVVLVRQSVSGAADGRALIVAVIGIMLIVAAAFGLEQRVSVLTRRVQRMQSDQRQTARAGQEQARSLYELAFQMGSTVDYQKIIEAALEAGRLGLSATGAADQLVASVHLFHSEDNALHVVSSRRLTRADEKMVTSGREGAVARALSESEPVLIDQPRKDPELQYFIAYQTCRSVLIIPLRTGFDNFGVLIYGSETPNAFSLEQSDVLIAVGIQTTIALQNAHLYQTLRDERDKIIEVEEDARKKLARDLHDGPTQSIAAIAMRMSYITRLIQKNPEQVPIELAKVEDLARRTTKEIRHMLFTLRPLVLETHGMAVALNQLAEKIRETHGQTVLVQVSANVDDLLDHHQQGVIFYVVEEAINNARKHARASIIRVTISTQGSFVQVTIADNGIGFDAADIEAGYENRGSLGMINMRERAELIDASLKIESLAGKGTIVTLLVPMRVAEAHHASVPAGTTTTRLAAAATQRASRTAGR